MSTPNSFDPNKLFPGKDATKESKPKSGRILMEVESYLTPPDGFHFAVGRRIDSPEEVIKVRLNTVAERHEDKPKDSLEKINADYVTSAKPRSSIADKAREGVRFLGFDDARPLQADGQGVMEFRAHWPKSLATDKNAEVAHGMAHIHLVEAANGKKAQAYVELVTNQTIATKDNIDAAMAEALTPKDSLGRPREPIMILRASHEGQVVNTPRIYPAVEKVPGFDQARGVATAFDKPVTADKTIAGLMGPTSSAKEIEVFSQDRARALIAGVKQLREPEFYTTDLDKREYARNLFFGAISGAIEVEVVAVQKIDFGKDSSASYVADKDRAHLKPFTIQDPVPGSEGKTRPVAGFAETVVAMNRHADGAPYVVNAVPVAMYPTTVKFMDIPAAKPEVNAPEKTKDSEARNAPSP